MNSIFANIKPFLIGLLVGLLGAVNNYLAEEQTKAQTNPFSMENILKLLVLTMLVQGVMWISSQLQPEQPQVSTVKKVSRKKAASGD